VLTWQRHGSLRNTAPVQRVTQFQYSFLDIEYQAGTRGLQYAANRGLAVVVMEPLRGGALARNIPPAVQAVWNSYQPAQTSEVSQTSEVYPRTPADWALQWLWNQPEVSLVLSGMSTMEQVEQNLASADRSGVGTMTEQELALVAKAREAYQALCAIPCTACQYCLPCPNKVAIPDIFDIYNGYLMFGDEERSSTFYGWLDDGTRADACIECGACLEKCPQGMEIPEWMKVVHEALRAKG